MTSLQPLQCLNLDTVQQQAFVKYYNSLPEKPPTTVRIFDRNEYYSVHGIDATTSAKEVFSSISNIKKLGVEPNRLDYLVLSKGNFEILVKKLLLVKRYRVEIFVSCGPVKACDWELRYKASPGCLEQLEDIIEGGLGAQQHASSLMAVSMRVDSVTKGRLVGVVCISTADFTLSVSEFTDDELLTQLETVTVQMSPRECVVPTAESEEYKALRKVMERANVTVTNLKRSDFSTEGLIQDLNRLLKFKDSQQQDANVFVETRMDVAMSSVAAAVKYMSLMTDRSQFGRYRLETIQTETFLHVDASAMAALNVFPEEGDNSGAPSRSLYALLDRCRTQHGKRLLAQWLRQPLRDINLINERLDIVEALVNKSQVRLQLYEEHLRKLPDLQALARRLTRKKANLHDCYRIYQALRRLPQLLQCMSEAESTTIHSALTEPIAELASDLEKFQQMIESTLDLDAVDRGDFLVKPSFDENLTLMSETLDELRDAAQKELNKAARDLGLDATKTIKLEVNPQTGFFFRVTLKEEQNLRNKKKYIIIDAVKGGVRFKTTALERVNEDYVQMKNSYELEQEKVVGEIVAIAAGYSDCLLCLSHLLSRVDVLVAFSMAAVNAPEAYVRPEIVESLDEFTLEGARHPCLEIMEGVSYIANDVKFERGKCLMQIVTGPNMGGKSTWMRSAGVSSLLAHVGSFVPCARAVIPRLRAICARVGAADSEICAQSTFMREMLDTAAILRIATPDSLVLIDELGRGTSTYEGCGLAWAIAEELATKIKCFCLFATHYHELTRLAALHPGAIVNRHAAASYTGGQLVLYRKIEEGASANSLGLQLAAAAALPEALLKYAEEKQAELETNLFGTENENTSEGQQILVDFLTKCKEIEASTTSDKEVMNKIQDLKNELFKMDNKYVKAFMV